MEAYYNHISVLHFKAQIAKSNKRIEEALDTLAAHDRGQCALQDLRRLFTGPAKGLDSAGAKAVLALCEEFFLNARRDFVKPIDPNW